MRSLRVWRLVVVCTAVLGVLATEAVTDSAPASAKEAHTFLSSFPPPGKFYSLAFPLGVAVNQSTGDLYVVDQGDHRVLELGPKGEFLLMFGKGVNPKKATGVCTQTEANEGIECQDGTAGPGPGEFSSPFGVAVDNTPGPFDGDVYVDDLEGVVDRYSSTGEYQTRFDGSETPGGSFESYGLTVDQSTGDVYVADAAHSVVDAFTPEGKYVEELFSGKLSAPGGIAIDGHGDVYVTNPGEGGLLLKFTSNGHGGFEEPITINDSNSYHITPRGVAVDPVNGFVYQDVNDYIAAFDEAGNLLGEFGSEQLGNSPGIAVYGGSNFSLVYAVDAFAHVVYAYETFQGPTDTTGAVSAVRDTSAEVEGTVDPESMTVTACFFEYGAGQRQDCEPPAAALTGKNEAITVSAKLEGLQPGKRYDYRLVVESEGHPVDGADEPFTTAPVRPIVVSESASQIFPQTGLLSAVVNPGGLESTYRFLYGPTTGYGSSAPASEVPLGTGSEGLLAIQSIGDLQPDTTYHYAVQASNPAGVTLGPDQTFTTPPAAVPLVTTGTASEVSQNTAMISGTVNPQGVPTSYEFDLGTDTTYGSHVFGEVGGGTEPVSLSLSLQDLAAGTLYHYRLVATNTYGTVYGADQTFTTPGFPSALITGPVGAPLVPTPVFTAPSTSSATVEMAPGKAKHKTRKRAKTKKKERGGKARKASGRRGEKGRGGR